jgi:aryl-alcohol dehydrogenase-like predicted oxidoreductase
MKYKLLGKSGLRVSEICLGTMTFGEDWGWGAPKKICRELVHAFLDAGGNFIDTASNYTNGSSERITGELLEGMRKKIVLATKYTLMTDPTDINSGGNQRKNMMQSVEESLGRLKTDYIDLYQVHIRDRHTPVEEVIRGLDDLVRSGKVLYTGISDTPAWVISKANAMAEERHWTRFNAIQVEYNLIERTSERELIPMAEEEKLSVLAWSPLAGGLLSGKYSSKRKKEKDGSRLEGNPRLNDRNLAIADALIEVAGGMSIPAATAALAWIRRNPDIIPIVGARNPEQLRQNLDCVNYSLSDEHLERLEVASGIKLGFPHDFAASDGVRKVLYGPFRDNFR